MVLTARGCDPGATAAAPAQRRLGIAALALVGTPAAPMEPGVVLAQGGASAVDRCAQPLAACAARAAACCRSRAAGGRRHPPGRELAPALAASTWSAPG